MSRPTSRLKYTTGEVDKYPTQIRASLCAAGFGRVVPATSADNPSVHRKLFLLSGNPHAFTTDREPGGSVGAALLEGDDAILTLGAFRRKGSTIETVVIPEPTHTFKNGGQQVLHLARLLMLGT